MKQSNKIFAGLTALALLTSCADDAVDFYKPSKRPASLENYAYLNDYMPLKEYVDRSANPNFKLTAALAAADYNQKDLVYALANSNFDEIVAGNAMKFASCVDDDGAMDFGTVEDFVETAKEAKMTVFGHTLAWHSQQRPGWLNSLIADRLDPNYVPEEGELTEIEDYMIDYTKESKFPFYVMGYEPDFSGGMMHTVKPEDSGWYQYFAADNIKTTPGTDYKVTVYAKASEEANFNVNMGWGWGDGEQVGSRITIGTEWGEYSCTFKGVDGTSCNVVCQPGGFAGEIDYQWLKVTHMGTLNKGTWLKAGVKYPTYPAFNNLIPEKVGKGEDPENAAGFFTSRVLGNADVDTEVDGDGVFFINATAKAAEAWDNQFFITIPEHTFEAGEQTHISFKYKAATAAKASTQCHAKPGGYIHWSAIGDVNFTTDWQTFERDFKIPSECEGRDMQTIAFNLNEYEGANTYYFDDIQWAVVEEKSQLVPNYGCKEGGDMSGFIIKVDRGDPAPATDADLVDDGSGGKCIVVRATAKVSDAWDNQFWINTPLALFDGGEVCKISFRYKADTEAKASTQCHGEPGGYIHWAAIGDVNFTTEWQTFTWEGKIPGECAGREMHSIAFNLNEFEGANNYYFDDIVWECTQITEVPDAPAVPLVPLTPEEKKDTLTWAMERWIKGMMNATKGNVVAWDLVNEAVSGGGSIGGGFYELQHYETANEDDKKNCFYWQDYLGDVDYVVIASKAALKYFQEAGGNPADLKLFVNDYNLESTWDNLQKVKSYAQYWIPAWEQGGAKIDGFGTQMHISYNADPAAQKRQEDAIVEMFKIMASTGKLVRVSELDMGYVEDGVSLKTSELTFDQEEQMAKFYSFIIKAYFDNVPAAQRYGFAQWCITDAPASSGWRGGEPVGLWTEGYDRKPAYAGWAEGLQGKEYQPRGEKK